MPHLTVWARCWKARPYGSKLCFDLAKVTVSHSLGFSIQLFSEHLLKQPLLLCWPLSSAVSECGGWAALKSCLQCDNPYLGLSYLGYLTNNSMSTAKSVISWCLFFRVQLLCSNLSEDDRAACHRPTPSVLLVQLCCVSLWLLELGNWSRLKITCV